MQNVLLHDDLGGTPNDTARSLGESLINQYITLKDSNLIILKLTKFEISEGYIIQ